MLGIWLTWFYSWHSLHLSNDWGKKKDLSFSGSYLFARKANRSDIGKMLQFS